MSASPRGSAGVLVALAACRPEVAGERYLEPSLAPPELARVELACDPDKERWELRVEATAWTGGAALSMTEDAEYVETHDVRSLEAAADGSWDRLELTLRIAADWREVKEGASTAFPCTAAPNVILWLSDAEGKRADCWAVGPEPRIWEDVGGIPPCPVTAR